MCLLLKWEIQTVSALLFPRPPQRKFECSYDIDVSLVSGTCRGRTSHHWQLPGLSESQFPTPLSVSPGWDHTRSLSLPLSFPLSLSHLFLGYPSLFSPHFLCLPGLTAIACSSLTRWLSLFFFFHQDPRPTSCQTLSILLQTQPLQTELKVVHVVGVGITDGCGTRLLWINLIAGQNSLFHLPPVSIRLRQLQPVKQQRYMMPRRGTLSCLTSSLKLRHTFRSQGTSDIKISIRL